jgi:AraC-like DNA-binding protein
MFFVYTRPESERLDALAERSEQTMNKRFLSSGAAECIPKSLVSTTDTGILDYALERGQADACRQALKACLNELAGKDSFYQELSPFYRQVVLLLINKYMAHQMPIPDSLKQEFSLFALCRYPNLESLGAHLNGMVLSLAQKIGGQTRSGELVQEVCEYLKIKYSEEIALNDVAAHFYVSPPYLSRRFREKTGLTFVEYLEDIRMDRAREYLLNSSAQIADISEQVGYLDPAYFAKIFKKKYNLSPSEYRMKNKS